MSAHCRGDLAINLGQYSYGIDVQPAASCEGKMVAYLGDCLGVWRGGWCLEWFFLEYHATRTLRVFGFPIPAAFFHYEGPPGQEKWIDFITPSPMLFAGSNIFIVGMIAACPVGLAFWLWSVHRGHR